MNSKIRFDFKSIRFRLWLYFLSVALVILALIWFLQIFFLNNYYERMKINEVTRIADSVYQSYQREDEDLTDNIQQYSILNDYYFMMEYSGKVLLFSPDQENAKPVYTYQSNDRYIFDAHLYNDGSVVLCAGSTRSGRYYAEILKGNIRSDEVKTVWSSPSVMPLTMLKSDSNMTAVLCTDTVLFFSGDELVAEYGFYGRVCRRFACGDGYTAILLSSEGAGADSELMIFDKTGTLIHKGQSSSDMSALYVHGGNVYGLYTGCVERYEINTEKTYRADTGYEVKGLVFPDNEIVLFATASSAAPVSVYDGFKEIR